MSYFLNTRKVLLSILSKNIYFTLKLVFDCVKLFNLFLKQNNFHKLKEMIAYLGTFVKLQFNLSYNIYIIIVQVKL